MGDLDVQEPVNPPEKETLLYRFVALTGEAVDQYASLCDSIVTSSVSLMRQMTNMANSFVNNMGDTLASVFSLPISIISTVGRFVLFILNIFLLPMRIFQYLGSNFPILTAFLVCSLLLTIFVIHRITRQSFLQYLLHTAVPYAVSLAYSILSLVFPQLDTASRLLRALLHPIRWLLGFAETVDRRAAPIRRTVEIFSPPRGAKAFTRSASVQESLNADRVVCCVCVHREKSVLLRPCHHLCLCEGCLPAIMRQLPPRCPICRTDIEEHINVYL